MYVAGLAVLTTEVLVLYLADAGASSTATASGGCVLLGVVLGVV